MHEMEDKILKQERLRILNDKKEYYQALRLSLELNRKHDFISTLKNYVNDNLNNRIDQIDESDHMSMIINNRKKLDEIENNKVDNSYKDSFNRIIKDKELRKILSSNIDKILEIVRDNNVKTTNFMCVQILLKIILVTTNYENFMNKKTIGLKNKKMKKIRKNIDYMENFEIIRSYSEKHLERINRELNKSYLLDYILEKIKII